MNKALKILGIVVAVSFSLVKIALPYVGDSQDSNKVRKFSTPKAK